MDVDEQIDAFDDPEALVPVYAGPELDPEREAVAVKPAPIDRELNDPELAPSIELARAALAEVTNPDDLGELCGIVDEGEGVYSLQFETKRPGYPDWRWTVSLIHLADEEAPTVLETELLPSEDSLLAPSWRPWAERLAEFEEAVAEREAAEAAAAEGSEGEDGEGRPVRRVQRIERTRRRRRTRSGEVVIEDSADAAAPAAEAEAEATESQDVADVEQDDAASVAEVAAAEAEAAPEPQAEDTSEGAEPADDASQAEEAAPVAETAPATPAKRRGRRRIVVDSASE